MKVILTKDGVIINEVVHLIGDVVLFIEELKSKNLILKSISVNSDKHLIMNIGVGFDATFLGKILDELFSKSIVSLDLTELLGNNITIIDNTTLTTAEVKDTNIITAP